MGLSGLSEEGTGSRDSQSLVKSGGGGIGSNRAAGVGSEDGVVSKASASLVSGLGSSLALPASRRPLVRANSAVSAGSEKRAASDVSDSTAAGGTTDGAKPPRKRLSVN